MGKLITLGSQLFLSQQVANIVGNTDSGILSCSHDLRQEVNWDGFFHWFLKYLHSFSEPYLSDFRNFVTESTPGVQECVTGVVVSGRWHKPLIGGVILVGGIILVAKPPKQERRSKKLNLLCSKIHRHVCVSLSWCFFNTDRTEESKPISIDLIQSDELLPYMACSWQKHQCFTKKYSYVHLTFNEEVTQFTTFSHLIKLYYSTSISELKPLLFLIFADEETRQIQPCLRIRLGERFSYDPTGKVRNVCRQAPSIRKAMN